MIAVTTRFTPTTQDALVELLVAQRAEVAHCVAALRREVSEAMSHSDISDLLDAEDPAPDSDAVTVLILMQQAEARLWEIDAALGRAADGSYGYCVHCAEPIPLIRLRALPATVSCVGCSRLSSQRIGGSRDRRHRRPVGAGSEAWSDPLEAGGTR